MIMENFVIFQNMLLSYFEGSDNYFWMEIRDSQSSKKHPKHDESWLRDYNESSELFFKGSKDEKGCSKSFFLFPRIVVSRVSSSFVCLRAIRFLSHHWILRDLRYFAWLHFIFAYQFEGNNKFSMGILLLPLPCQQTSAYNMKETMLKTKTKTDTNDNTNSSLHKLVHYSYE